MNIAAVALVASLVASQLPYPLPYPPPRSTPVTEKLKCDTGSVVAWDEKQLKLKVITPAGPVVYRAAADVQVYDKAGKVWGTVAKLAAGLRVRVYYLILEDGPRVGEVDLAE
jgi:hypothetical protein